MRAGVDNCNVSLRHDEILVIQSALSVYEDHGKPSKEDQMLVASISDRMRHALLASKMRREAAEHEVEATQ